MPLRTRKIRITFPEDLIREPVVHTLSSRFDLVTNIRRADVRETTGWVVLELTGTDERMDDGLAYLEEIGARVDDLESFLE